MTNINLIKTETKKKLLHEQLIFLIKDFVFLILFSITISGIFIFISKIILSENFKNIEQQKNSVKTLSNPFTQEIEQINSLLNSAETIQNKYQKWSPILTEMDDLIPQGITLSHLELNSEEKAFSISGLAPTRDSFLELKNSLEKSSIFTGVESPLSNLLSQENVYFSLSGKLYENNNQ